jgi:hypothetical protein
MSGRIITYLDFQTHIQMVPTIVDFKHYFSVSLAYIQKVRPQSFVCRLSQLYREDLSQRFAVYLARIALPEVAADSAQVREAASN